jgi:pimeloyl-ACP methyl ester carboxylesterase
VGYSLGGIIAGAFIAKHPERVLSGTLSGMGWLKDGGIGQLGFAQIGKRDPDAAAVAVCGRSLAKLALTEGEIRSIRVPMLLMVGANDRLIKRLYVEPARAVRPDWPVIEIPDANHLTCILKPQFREEIATWLQKQAN